MGKSNIEKWDEDVAKNGCITQDQIRCITFDKEVQDNLPQYIKDKMKADREAARNKKHNQYCRHCTDSNGQNIGNMYVCPHCGRTVD